MFICFGKMTMIFHRAGGNLIMEQSAEQKVGPFKSKNTGEMI